jgi:hypothetical protein
LLEYPQLNLTLSATGSDELVVLPQSLQKDPVRSSSSYDSISPVGEQVLSASQACAGKALRFDCGQIAETICLRRDWFFEEQMWRLLDSSDQTEFIKKSFFRSIICPDMKYIHNYYLKKEDHLIEIVDCMKSEDLQEFMKRKSHVSDSKRFSVFLNADLLSGSSAK